MERPERVTAPVAVTITDEDGIDDADKLWEELLLVRTLDETDAVITLVRVTSDVIEKTGVADKNDDSLGEEE